MTCREPRTNLRPLGLERGSWVGSPGQGRGSPAWEAAESQRVGGFMKANLQQEMRGQPSEENHSLTHHGTPDTKRNMAFHLSYHGFLQ